ncbi:inositol monophosphatase family protein [Reichenbachiella carrageenanivorans]|uniref:Inositol monophosphatase family protein n=1 Tax=Reichenbachiella carrageenanivorans TaxID=2979869 RepID=A0ABY6D0M7_9BACT|nr:inositol monophosphatase family protein [Reichenbachiella carrageenanivorans]UXX78613.1 inositol monophosphatase family protein [Reichenbachiella carrageenanivorans]
MKLTTGDLYTLAALAKTAAQDASAYIREQVQLSHEISYKAGVDSLATQVVTEIDLGSQRIIWAQLKATLATYDLGWLSEESADDGSRLIKDYFWCIDPLDGTLPFTLGEPGYAVSIALVARSGESVLGVVADPYHQQIYQAIKGKGSLKGDQPLTLPVATDRLHVHFDRSFTTSISYESTREALQTLCTRLGFADYQIHTGYGAVMNALGLLTLGSGCYFKLPKPNRGGGCIWDYAATSLIYHELGAQATDIHGQLLALNRKDSPYMNTHGVIYATNEVLHKELLSLGQQVIL